MGTRRRIVRKKRTGSFGKKLLLLLGVMLTVVAIIFGASILTFFSGLRSGLTPAEGEGMPKVMAGERVNILVLGIDVPLDSRGNVNYNMPSRTDTMMLVTMDTNDSSISVLSIPRDTRVQIPGKTGHYRINSAHVYGGPGLSVKTVSEFLDIPIHYYVRTNVDGFAAIIDILGGVKIEVERDMYYVDIYQDLVIDLKAGRQVLDGNQAMQYVRYRGDGSDIRRIGRQQRFLAAVADEFLEISTLFKLPRLAGELVKHIDTNMKQTEMMNLAKSAVLANADKIVMNTIPGEGRTVGGASYWIADMRQTQQIIDKQVWGIDRDENAQINVEVYNGTESRGLATTVANLLKEKGFNVTRIDNADSTNYLETRIIAYCDDDSKLTALRKVFSMGSLYRDIQNDSNVDIAIIVGQDFIR